MWYVWLIDHEKKKFRVIGPTPDDIFWTNRTAEIQKEGRNVNCFTTDSKVNLEQEKSAYAVQQGYEIDQRLDF